MAAEAVFPRARARAGMYESFYLRAVSREQPVGVWIRHTIHKAPGAAPTGSVWCTVFDTRRGAPFMHKLSGRAPSVPAAGWLTLGEDARIGPSTAEGSCGPARWSLRFAAEEPPLRHLSPDWLYRMPLPRTKLTSPAPRARFDGVIELDGRDPIELRGWSGMIGHNWGSEHAERWIWLHGIDFDEEPGAWLDVALGRLALAGRMTPWVANGALSLDGRRRRIGGLATRGLRVSEDAGGATIDLPGRHGQALRVSVRVPPGTAAGWRYADPDGGEHDVVNCSVAPIELALAGAGGAAARTLRSAHGGAYELGMRERDHGVAISPFADG
jgi:hypothetical protein